MPVVVWPPEDPGLFWLLDVPCVVWPVIAVAPPGFVYPAWAVCTVTFWVPRVFVVRLNGPPCPDDPLCVPRAVGPINPPVPPGEGAVGEGVPGVVGVVVAGAVVAAADVWFRGASPPTLTMMSANCSG